MSVKVKELLEQEIESQIEALDDIEYGSDQHSACVGDTVRLLEKLNEMNRIEQDHIDKEESRKLEEDLKLKEMAENKKDRLWKNVLTAGTFVVSAGITIWGYVDSKRFEQGFTHTTEAGRTSTRKLLGLLDKFK